MKKLFTAIAAGLFLFAGASVANAAPSLANTAVKEGTPFNLYQNTYVVFTPSISGDLTMKVEGERSTWQDYLLTAAPTGEWGDPYVEAVSCEPTYNNDDVEYITYVYMGIEAGKPYYIYYVPGFDNPSEYLTITVSMAPHVNEYSIVSMSPAAGPLAGLETGAEITIELNKESYMAPFITVLNMDSDQPTAINSYNMEQVNDDDYTTWKFTVPDYDPVNQVVFYKDLKYQAIFKVGNEYLEGDVWTGTTLANPEGTPTFESVSPENNSALLPEAQDITITFTGPVTISSVGYSIGSGASNPLTATPVNPDETGASSEWNIALTTSGADNPLNPNSDNMELLISATVKYGENVIKFWNEEDMAYYDYLPLTYSIFGKKNYKTNSITVQLAYVGKPALELSTNPEQPTVIPTEDVPITGFNIWNSNPVIPNSQSDSPYGDIAVYNPAGGLVTFIDTEEDEDEDGSETQSGYDIKFQNAISENGIYKLVIPETAFNTSADQGANYYNEETVVWFQIGTQTVEYPSCPKATVTPANNSEVYSLENLRVNWGNVKLSNLNKSMISVNEVIKGFSQPIEFSAYISPAIDTEAGDVDELIISVDNVEGTIEVIIGQSAVNLTINGMLIGNDPIELSYVVDNSILTPLKADVSEIVDEETGDITGWLLAWPNVTSSYFSPEAAPLSVKGDNNQTYTVTPGQEMLAGDGILTIDLSEFPAGVTYTMNLPEGYIILSGGYVSASETLSLKTTGIESINTEIRVDGGVYNLQGVKVGNSLNGLRKGIYIINGKKVAVK